MPWLWCTDGRTHEWTECEDRGRILDSEFAIVMSGQFHSLAMFSHTCILFSNVHLFFSFPLILCAPKVRRGEKAEHNADFSPFLCRLVPCLSTFSHWHTNHSLQTPFTHLSLRRIASSFTASHSQSPGFRCRPHLSINQVLGCCWLGATSTATGDNSIILWERLWRVRTTGAACTKTLAAIQRSHRSNPGERQPPMLLRANTKYKTHKYKYLELFAHKLWQHEYKYKIQPSRCKNKLRVFGKRLWLS